jgi:hypothetical protein
MSRFPANGADIAPRAFAAVKMISPRFTGVPKKRSFFLGVEAREVEQARALAP